MNNRREDSLFKLLLRSVTLLFKASPWHATANNLLAIANALPYTFLVITTERLFNAVSKAEAGNAGFVDCLIPLLAMSAVTLIGQMTNGFGNFYKNILTGKAGGEITALLHDKLLRVDPAEFEQTSFLNDVNKACAGVSALCWCCAVVFSITSFYFVYFLSIGAYLFSLKPILLIVLLLAFIPALLVQIVRVKVFTKLEKQSAPLRRQYEYYQKTLCDREYLKETRVLGAFQFFHNLFTETLQLFTCVTWRAERKIALLQLLLNMTTFAGMAIASYILFTAAMEGEITIGAFAAVFAALANIFSIMQEIVTQHVAYVNNNIGKVANLFQMLDMPERTGAVGVPDFTKGVVAESVSFTYPGKDEPAVKDVSLTIADGETIAIVGENGAGKSTLVRLLTGIYLPSDGCVIAGGLNTSETAPECVYMGVSGVFQRYQRYKMTLCDNVRISDVNIEADAATIESALEEAGAELEGVGLDEMLSPEFDGIDLSGGQWQRLAIARGLYRANGFIVLDEPTASIDPVEETRIYAQFHKLTKGKCAIIVTHRLGSARLADRIVVMDASKIVDIGTHDELLSHPGKYAEMWTEQARWYERE